MSLSKPHGGKLIDRWNPDFGYSTFTESVELDEISISDVDLIGTGAYSPLSGFLTEADYHSVNIGREQRLNSSHVASSYAVSCLKKKMTLCRRARGRRVILQILL